MRFSKENSYYSTKGLKKKVLLLLANKLIEKILDPRIDKVPIFYKKEKQKISQTIRNNYSSTKCF